ncbi:hypothetical protein [Salaquimonas pukyongi]|uniref:hypothetical protein n=1 Tax=Salaquimonas pukyongi TaxID=2712698 RepID=UPI00096B9206|nr:hypothetical protein [Salaquimonas pukyongi]
MQSIPHTKARRLVVLSAGALMLATLSGGPVSTADAASIRLDPASRYYHKEAVEVTQVAIKNKAQARRHLAKIKRLTKKLKAQSAKLKTATAKVKRITATLR